MYLLRKFWKIWRNIKEKININDVSFCIFGKEDMFLFLILQENLPFALAESEVHLKNVQI